jgi:hypothetical protein
MNRVVPLVCHFNGVLSFIRDRPHYVGGLVYPTGISRDILYEELVAKMYELTSWSSNEGDIMMKWYLPVGDTFTLVDVVNNVTLQHMFHFHPDLVRVFMIYVDRTLGGAPGNADYRCASNLN